MGPAAAGAAGAAVVVGAAQGIGLAIARLFAAERARVALVDRDARVEGAAREFDGLGRVGATGELFVVRDVAADDLGHCHLRWRGRCGLSLVVALASVQRGHEGEAAYAVC